MLIAFSNRELRNLCQDESLAKKIYGEKVAIRLKSRLADIRAATNLGDLIVGNLRQSTDYIDRFFIDLNEAYKIVICSNHKKKSMIDITHDNWKKINRVQVLEIAEVHHASRI